MRRALLLSTVALLGVASGYVQAPRAQATARTYTADRNGPTLTLTETETGLSLIITRTGSTYDFNGFTFASEVEARTFLEAYAGDAIRRHNLSATNKAR